MAFVVPALPSVTVDVVDRERRLGVVVGDRAEAAASAIGRVARVAEVDAEGLVDLVQGVAVDRDGDVLVVSPGAKSSVPLAAW